MLKIYNFHTNIHTETFAPLITALLKSMPNVDQALLQYIDVMNLVDLLLHFSRLL